MLSVFGPGDKAASSKAEETGGMWDSSRGDGLPEVVADASACKPGDSAGMEMSPAKLTPAMHLHHSEHYWTGRHGISGNQPRQETLASYTLHQLEHA